MKNIFLSAFLMWPLVIFASDTEVTWTGFGGETSMTGENANDSAGFSLAISTDGSIVVVGEAGWSGGRGRVRAYNLKNNSWTQFGGPISMTGENGGDQAGYSLAISSEGSIIAVGEFGWSGSRGRVRTYRLENDTWTEFGGATSMTGQAASDNAGNSIAINFDGTLVAVAERSWSGGSGRVRTYILNGDIWTETGGSTSMVGENAVDLAGFSIAMNSDGTILAVGEYGWNGAGNDSGRVKTYRLENGVWTEFGGATSMTGQNTNDSAGRSVALSSDGRIVAVGEFGWSGFGSDGGRVRTYKLENDTWTEFGGATSMTGVNTLGSQSFRNIALNFDGKIIALGQVKWNSAAGRVRTYKLENEIWTEFGGATSMTGQNTNDFAGSSVALSSNGNIVAVGEYGWDGVGNSSGRVRTYFYPSYNDNETEARIRNSELAHVCYSDISQGTYTDHQTTPGGVGQGAWFTPYRITVQGR